MVGLSWDWDKPKRIRSSGGSGIDRHGSRSKRVDRGGSGLGSYSRSGKKPKYGGSGLSGNLGGRKSRAYSGGSGLSGGFHGVARQHVSHGSGGLGMSGAILGGRGHKKRPVGLRLKRFRWK